MQKLTIIVQKLTFTERALDMDRLVLGEVHDGEPIHTTNTNPALHNDDVIIQ